MIASLPMYATPRTAAADARFWAGIRDALRIKGQRTPAKLTLVFEDLMAHWRNPGLVLSQTCSLPYRQELIDDVILVGTPDYGVKGCPPGHYRSLIIARADDKRAELKDFAGARFAYNDPMSQSGWAAMAMEAPELLCKRLLKTGSHRASVLAVQAGTADFAAIDAVSLRHMTTAGEAAGLKILHGTQPTPGLPFIAAKGCEAALIYAAIADAIAALSTEDRSMLQLQGIVALPPSAYDIPLPPPPQAFTA